MIPGDTQEQIDAINKRVTAIRDDVVQIAEDIVVWMDRQERAFRAYLESATDNQAACDAALKILNEGDK